MLLFVIHDNAPTVALVKQIIRPVGLLFSFTNFGAIATYARRCNKYICTYSVISVWQKYNRINLHINLNKCKNGSFQEKSLFRYLDNAYMKASTRRFIPPPPPHSQMVWCAATGLCLYLLWNWQALWLSHVIVITRRMSSPGPMSLSWVFHFVNNYKQETQICHIPAYNYADE